MGLEDTRPAPRKHVEADGRCKLRVPTMSWPQLKAELPAVRQTRRNALEIIFGAPFYRFPSLLSP